MKDGSFQYSLIIDPDGSASYYDFTRADKNGSAKASMFFECALGSTEDPTREKQPTESEK